MSRGSVWIGDLLQAYEALDASTPDRRAAIARTLGLAGTPAPASRSDSAPLGPAAPADPPPDAHPSPQDGTAGGSEAGSGVPAELPDGEPGALAVVGYDPPRVMVSGGLVFGADRPPTAPPARHLPLLRPQSARAVLQALLAQQVEDGAVDLPALVHAVAVRRVSTLPRRRVSTLRYGVQVLVDNGEAMAPFAADQDHLVDQIREVVGKERTDVRYFADSPLRGNGPGPVWTWRRRYRPPPPGTPVLILSDLGILPRWDVSAARPAEWAAFARRLRAAGSTGIALVPCPPARWPAWVRRSFVSVMWDRSLTVGGAKVSRA
jgi:hypothetical protein